MYKNVVKPSLDIFLAVVLFIITLPIFIICSVLVLISSKGPIIFKQKRTGKGGKIFNILKFRTMKVETEIDGRLLTHDERTTKIGQFLRKTSLDELPQIINIIKGEMSFIGPRPWIPEYYDVFAEYQKHRVDVKPGLTGLAQARGRNGINIFKKIQYDLEYVSSLSFLLDIKVIIETIASMLRTCEAEIKQEEIQDEINMLKMQ